MFPDWGYILYVDRYYALIYSLELAVELQKLNIQTTGTVMGNRSVLPLQVSKKKYLKELKLEQEYASFTLNDSVHCLVWRDKRILMLSTSTGNSAQVIERKVKGKVLEKVTKPTVVCEYNRFMGGVDLADHYISSYSFVRKSVKWWRKLFFWMLDAYCQLLPPLLSCKCHLEQKRYLQKKPYSPACGRGTKSRKKQEGRKTFDK